MENITEKRDPADSGLRLVPGSSDLPDTEAPRPQFVNFIFFRISPEWRRLSANEKAAFKSEFCEVYESFREHLLLFSYSLVGFDSKADLMLWRIGESLDTVQEMTAALYRTGLGRFLETAYSYLSTTKTRVFVDSGADDRLHVVAGSTKYHFVYPCSKIRDWADLPAERRDAIIKENFMVGQRFPNIRIHMTHTFGFSETEYLISFETDEPRAFLALAEELRETEASRFAVRGTPIYICRRRPLVECLDALG